jgi:hypothetical protein
MGLDMKVRDNFLRRIEKWNSSSESKKFGRLEIALNLAEADIVLARYTLNENARTHMGSSTIAGVVWDAAANTTVTRPVQRTFSYSTVPVFAYVLIRENTDLEIVFRYSDTASLGEHRRSGVDLWDNFLKLVKAAK